MKTFGKQIHRLKYVTLWRWLLRPLLAVMLSLSTRYVAWGQDPIDAGLIEANLVQPAANVLSAPDLGGVEVAFATSTEDQQTDDMVRLVDYQQRISNRIDRYLELEYLLYWAGNSTLPPLLTTNPNGSPLADVGLLGGATTSVLDGNKRVGDFAQSGFRLSIGRYFRGRRVSRIELGLWMLFPRSDEFEVTSTGGDPILARPFFNSASGAPDAQIISYPGISDGSFHSKYTRQALGLDPLLFACLYGNGCNWLEFYSGYRFLWLKDELTIQETAIPAPGGLIAPGTRFEITDNFEAENSYNLIPLGLSYSRNRGRWNVNLRGDIGIGFVAQTVTIRGQTDSYIGDNLFSREPAGLLALGTNSGKHSRTKFAIVPQLKISGRYSLTDRMSASAGYSLIFLADAVKAADHVPTAIDPGNIPPVDPTAGPDPRFTFTDDAILLHGFNFGLRFDY